MNQPRTAGTGRRRRLTLHCSRHIQHVLAAAIHARPNNPRNTEELHLGGLRGIRRPPRLHPRPQHLSSKKEPQQ